MSQIITSKKKAKAFSFALFLVGLAVLSYLGTWWPGIMLVVGLPLALRQYLLGRSYDVGVTLLVFVGVFITVQFEISWQILLPVIFTIGGIYIFFREFLESTEEPETEREEDLNEEIEEEQHKRE